MIPPKLGAKGVATANELMTIARFLGRVSSGEVTVMMARAPWISPAVPVPAIARPSINMGEEGAAAHIVEPTISTR